MVLCQCAQFILRKRTVCRLNSDTRCLFFRLFHFQNTEYANGYHKDHPRIIEFWEILENFDVELKKKFLGWSF